MANQEFNVVAILHPKQGKTDEVHWPYLESLPESSLMYDKVIDLINEVAKYVKDNEPGTLRYEINRSLRAGKDGNEDIVMLER